MPTPKEKEAMELTRERITTGFEALKLAAEATGLNTWEVDRLRDLALRAEELSRENAELREELDAERLHSALCRDALKEGKP